MISSRPYLIRALHEWIVDNGLTPYLLVDAEREGAQVPQQHVESGKIVLNLSPGAVRELHIGNQEVSFNTRFGGRPMLVKFPVGAALAIYAKENGQGMVFAEEDGDTPPEPPSTKPSKPSLKVIK